MSPESRQNHAESRPDLVIEIGGAPLAALDHLPGHGQEGRIIAVVVEDRFPGMSRHGAVEFDPLPVNHPGMTGLADGDVVQIVLGDNMEQEQTGGDPDGQGRKKWCFRMAP
ncbi:MAG: hypothetical protein C0392_14950 [Syntrophus sp. (in: bacteria)]|nr:hypothetical protein [Syntrophus sp. (in: bacteria)]